MSNDNKSDSERVAELEDTVERLEAELQQFRSQFDRLYQNSIKSRFEAAKDGRDDLSEQLSEQGTALDELSAEVHAALGGDRDTSPPAKQRVRDLRVALIRRARGGSKRTEGKASMTYRDVLDALADFGHGELHAKQAYIAMEQAAYADGFTDTKDGQGQRVILANLDELPYREPVEDFNNGQRGRSW